ncbi:MAG TPA: nucleotidyl transferase AbiEii/AbiGii toxin family protein [bacterium]|mgnify:CR=1 FL=1|nr:nucleotidyl transferase AbiEii/AbiGii toxin family protein [bacterium]
MRIFGKPEYFTKRHIEKVRGKIGTVLAEQAVHCLELVAALSSTGLKFRFKGGNSQLLLLPQPHRLSIDVDIATAEPRPRIIEAVASVADGDGVFTRWVHRQHKTKPWLPLASFEIFYRPLFQKEEQSFIMLDAILHGSPYPGQSVPVISGRLYQSSVRAEIPTPSGLAGDKLLTLGPRTLGIPFGKNKEGQRLKHVFDIARLIELGLETTAVAASVRGSMQQELDIQQRSMELREVYDDTMTLLTIPGRYPDEPALADDLPADVREVVVGREQLRLHLMSQQYDWRDLQRDAAAVAELFGAVMRHGAA